MEKQELVKKINELITDEFEVELSIIEPDANIKKSLQLDSLSLVDLIALLEENFNISLKGADVVNIQTFDSLYEYVYDRVALDH